MERIDQFVNDISCILLDGVGKLCVASCGFGTTVTKDYLDVTEV
jgi:hypothetical protein